MQLIEATAPRNTIARMLERQQRAVILALLSVLPLLVQPAAAQPCDDGFLCTTGDICVSKECTGERVECPDDGNACTRERCSASTGDCVAQPRDCEGPCLTGECDPSTGCIPKPEGSACDDRNACTTDDRCLLGVCGGTREPEGAPCADALGPCTVHDQCRNGFCAGEILTCPNLDGDRCTPEMCDFLTGACITWPRTLCDEPCQTGVCDAETGLCPILPDGSACDDENECSTEDGCRAGDCVAGGFVPQNTPTHTPAAAVSPSHTATSRPPTASPVAPTATARPATPTSRPITATPDPTRTTTAAAAVTATPAQSSWTESRGCAVAAPASSANDLAFVWLVLPALGLARRRRCFAADA